MISAEQQILSPLETLLLVIDIQKDFLEAKPGFVFHDAGNDTSNMRDMVKDYLVPFIRYSLVENAHVAYIRAEYSVGKFPKPYSRLCSVSPGRDFYSIDKISEFNRARIFAKNEHDSFTNQQLVDYVLQAAIRNLVVTGITTTTCINATITSRLMPAGLRIFVPINLIANRKEQEEKAQGILAYYNNLENERIILLNHSRQIIYK